MEVFSSDHTSDQFPEMVTPFPPSFDSFFPVSEVARGISTSLPPQKLRPIRCNAKTTGSCNNKAFHFQPCAGFGGRSTLDDVGRGGLCELGFSSNLRDEVDASGEAFRANEILAPVDAEVGKVEIKRQELPTYSSSSSESEVNGDTLENAEGSHNKKRRRATKTLEGFIENLASKVLLKQEMMQNELMEMIERKERERLIREEAWKSQEMERLRREEQVRAQETVQNVALITLIKNIMDKDTQIAKPSR